MDAHKRLMPNPIYTGCPMSTTVSYIASRSIDRDPGDGERRLGPFILPPFQRPPVWSRDQQTRLIESLWLGLPVGVFVFNQGQYGSRTSMWLLDGQQRITAVLDYLADGFPVFGKRFSETTDVDRRGFENKHFPCVKLEMTDRAAMEEIYYRLAYGGTPHDPLTEIPSERKAL